MKNPVPGFDWRADLQELVFAHGRDVMAGNSTEDVMRPVIDLALNRYKCCLVHVWSVDPRREKLVLVAQGCRQDVSNATVDVIDVASSYTGLAVETRQPQWHRLADGDDRRRFQNPAVQHLLGIESMLSLPIRNIGNPHQVTSILNLYWDSRLPEFAIDRALKDREFVAEVRRYAVLLASNFESNLRERAFRMSARVSQALGRVERLTEESGCSAFAKTVRDALDADWVTVYLENWNSTKLVRQVDEVASGLTIPQEEDVPSNVIDVWENKREFLVPDVAAELGEAKIVCACQEGITSAILVPLHDVKANCKGVVRCVNFSRSSAPSWRRRHSYEDIAIVESMERAFAPPLEMLLESQARDVALRSLSHELRVPVVALRAVHERMEREYDDAKQWFTFRYPYFTEAQTFTDVMQRLLQTIEIARVGPDRVAMSKQPTRLLSEVIQPAIRFMQPVLKQHGMSREQIEHQGFESTPKIDVDRALLTQLVFNLLDNMVKYFPKSRPRNEFYGTITCDNFPGRIEIVFADNGPGIAETDKERIFEFGYRSEGAEQSNVQGTGLGCWLAKEIAVRHSGRLSVRSCRPFQLVLELPNPRPRSFRPGFPPGL
jgi:signal transduction histidine kinase